MSCQAKQGVTGMYCIRCETCWDIDDDAPECKPSSAANVNVDDHNDLFMSVQEAKLLHLGDIQGLIEVAEMACDFHEHTQSLSQRANFELAKVRELLK